MTPATPRKIIYSRCPSCGLTDAPGCGMCMDCYQRGIMPCLMTQVYDDRPDETNPAPSAQ